jgi:hypothetical protein
LQQTVTAPVGVAAPSGIKVSPVHVPVFETDGLPTLTAFAVQAPVPPLKIF